MALRTGIKGAVAVNGKVVNKGDVWSLERISDMQVRMPMQGGLAEIVNGSTLLYQVRFTVPWATSGAAIPDKIVPGGHYEIGLYCDVDSEDEKDYFGGSVGITGARYAVDPMGNPVIEYWGLSGSMRDEYQITPKLRIGAYNFMFADPEWRDHGTAVRGKTIGGGYVYQGLGEAEAIWPWLYQEEFHQIAEAWEANKNGRVSCTCPPFTGATLSDWQNVMAALREPLRGQISRGLIQNTTMVFSGIGS